MLTGYTPGTGLHNSLHTRAITMQTYLLRTVCFHCCSYHRYGETSCDCEKVKQPLPLYLHVKTSNCCILVAVATVTTLVAAVALSLYEGLK